MKMFVTASTVVKP